MTQALLLRAAGAYADEVARHLGLLTLKASVLAGLRIQDGNKYAPDSRLIPKDPQRLFASLRSAWREYHSLGSNLVSYLEDRHQMEIRLEQMAETDNWNDPLALATVAASLRAFDPLALITLAANGMRVGSLQIAEPALAALIGRPGLSHSIRSRALRNMAGLEEKRGDLPRAVELSRLAAEADPTCTLARVDFFAYGWKFGSAA